MSEGGGKERPERRRIRVPGVSNRWLGNKAGAGSVGSGGDSLRGAGPRENRKGRLVLASPVNSVRRFCCKGEQRNGAVLGKEKCGQERSDSTFALIEAILKRVESGQGERGRWLEPHPWASNK